MKIFRAPAPARPALALLLCAAVLLSGCVTAMRTTGTHPATGTAEGGGVALRVFDDDDAKRAGTPSGLGVVTALERREGAAWKPVFRSLSARWAVAGLPPGKYRLRFDGVLDGQGRLQPFREMTRKVTVAEGQVTDVEVVLEHVSPVLVGIGVATAVVAAVLLHDWLDEHDLLPPLPDAGDLAEAVFYIALDVGTSVECCAPGVADVPFVTSHFPRDGETVREPRPRVVFGLSEALRPGGIDQDAIVVRDHRGVRVEGTVSYDPQHWWVVWEPERDLPAGEEFTVRLDPGAIENMAGAELPEPAQFSFRTP